MARVENIDQLIRRVERMQREIRLIAEGLYQLQEQDQPDDPRPAATVEITVKGKKVKI